MKYVLTAVIAGALMLSVGFAAAYYLFPTSSHTPTKHCQLVTAKFGGINHTAWVCKTF